jgi:predicted nucleic acid-binding protein
LIQLDTSFLVRALARGSAEDRRLRQWLASREVIRISAIAWAELLCGPLEPGQRRLAQEFLGVPIPFGAEDAEAAARLFNMSGRRRGTLADCMVAAVALRLDAPLATANPRDFRRLEPAGLSLAAYAAS